MSAIHLVKPLGNYKPLPWSSTRLQEGRTYWAMDATNQPDWKKQKLIFVMYTFGGEPASYRTLDVEGESDGILLSMDDVEIVEKDTDLDADDEWEYGIEYEDDYYDDDAD